MIYAVKEISVNRFREQGDPLLTRAQVWAGLQRKARNGVPFIPAMTRCHVVEDTEAGLIRDVAIRGMAARERVTFYPPKNTVFTRLSGPADGVIVNEILEGPDGELKRRFSFALQLVDVDSGSPEERHFSSHMNLNSGGGLRHPGGTHRYGVECKSAIDRKSQLHQRRQRLERLSEDGVLAPPCLCRELAEYCRTSGLQFIDLSGNAYLQAPGLLVFMTGEKRSLALPISGEPKGLTSAAALRVVFALRSHCVLLNAPFKHIASTAGVSLGTAYNVLDAFSVGATCSILAAPDGKKLREPARLIDEWTINFSTTLRTKLHCDVSAHMPLIGGDQYNWKRSVARGVLKLQLTK